MHTNGDNNGVHGQFDQQVVLDDSWGVGSPMDGGFIFFRAWISSEDVQGRGMDLSEGADDDGDDDI